MNQLKIALALSLLISIILPSCDSKPKSAPVEEQPTEEGPTEQAATQETPTEEGPAEQAATQETPTEEGPAEQAATQETPTEEGPAEQTAALPQQKIEYLKSLQSAMTAAMEEKDFEKAGQLAQEIQKLAVQIQEENNSSKTPESSEKAAESPETTPVIAQESKPVIKESASEPVPQTQRPVEIPKPTPPPKLKLLLDVVPKATSKRDGYYANEEISLKIKVTNQSLKEEVEDVTLHYFIIGKGTTSNNEYSLFNSGEKKFQLGKTHKDRLFELTTDICFNKYWAYGSSGYHKYDAWFVALLDKEGNVVQIKSNKSQFKDFNAFKALDGNSIFDKSLKKIQGRMRYRYN